MATVKENVILNVINTVMGLLFPLITFPYVSRIILPEGIGLIQFYQSIINYIVLLSSLGIPLYATREIARYRDDVETRNKVTLEILFLHSLLSIAAYIVVFILAFTINKIYSDWPLFLILSISIFFNVIGVSWFYQAIEDFKFITIRSLIIRSLSLIALFIFVKSKADLYAYAIILVAGQVGNYLFNFVRLRKYALFNNISKYKYNLKPHFYTAIKIFILNLAISLYININPVMLGFLSDEIYVGYYASVTKIITAVNGLSSAMGMAILPRLSNYFATGRLDEYNFLKTKALNVSIAICFPISIGLICVAQNLIPVFSGDAYLPAIITLRISAPTLLFSAINSAVAIQILYTQNKEKIVIVATILAGLLNVILNLLLIPDLKQNGTAISGLSAEIMVLVICFMLGKKYIGYNIWNKSNLQVFLVSLACGMVCLLEQKLPYSSFVLLSVQILSAIILYVFVMVMLKNDIISEYLNIIIMQVHKIIKS